MVDPAAEAAQVLENPQQRHPLAPAARSIRGEEPLELLAPSPEHRMGLNAALVFERGLLGPTVATDAGVSVAAVSKVLRNAYGVSPSLRERVQASIDKLGYRPNTAARGLRGRTFTVGVLVVELRNPFVPDIVDGANAALAQFGYKALIGVGRTRTALETALIELMIDHNMDGLI